MSMIQNYLIVTEAELEALYTEPERIVKFIYEEKGVKSVIDIDKAWHAIHFMLTGEVWGGDLPWFNVIMGGTPIGTVDLGQGQARGLHAAEVQEANVALQTIDDDTFRARFDVQELAEENVYPSVWKPEYADDELEGYLLPNFRTVRDLFATAAQNSNALIMYIN